MAISQHNLPEGTDSIVTGAGVDEDEDFGGSMGAASAGTSSRGKPQGSDKQGDGPAASPFAGMDWSADGIRSAFEGRAQGFMEKAGDHARDYVTQGLDRATTALDDVVRMVEDAAAQIDEKVGAQYGDYARSASGAISGFADTLRMKDADALFEDAREAVRKSPAIAVGAAATLGFLMVRIIKAGTDAANAAAGKAPTLAENDPIMPKA